MYMRSFLCTQALLPKRGALGHLLGLVHRVEVAHDAPLSVGSVGEGLLVRIVPPFRNSKEAAGLQQE